MYLLLLVLAAVCLLSKTALIISTYIVSLNTRLSHQSIIAVLFPAHSFDLMLFYHLYISSFICITTVDPTDLSLSYVRLTIPILSSFRNVRTFVYLLLFSLLSRMFPVGLLPRAPKCVFVVASVSSGTICSST